MSTKQTWWTIIIVIIMIIIVGAIEGKSMLECMKLGNTKAVCARANGIR